MTDPGLDAISTDRYVTVNAATPTDAVDDQGIDEWELEASRRILNNLRKLLDGKPMMDLIGGQIEESDRLLKQYLAESDGKFTGIQVKVKIQGITTKELMPTIRNMMSGAASPDEAVRKAATDMMFAAHPEHYTMPAGGFGVIETMGGLPTRSKPTFVSPDDVPSFVSDLIDPYYDLSTVGSATLADGTLFTYVLQEYKDTPEDTEVSLRIWYPAAAPKAYTEEHAHHYAVEFRNGCRLAAAQLHAGK